MDSLFIRVHFRSIYMCVCVQRRRLPHTLDGVSSPIGFRLPLIAIACPKAGCSLFVFPFGQISPPEYAANNAVFGPTLGK